VDSHAVSCNIKYAELLDKVTGPRKQTMGINTWKTQMSQLRRELYFTVAGAKLCVSPTSLACG
jgi:hypothetical protein